MCVYVQVCMCVHVGEHRDEGAVHTAQGLGGQCQEAGFYTGKDGSWGGILVIYSMTFFF